MNWKSFKSEMERLGVQENDEIQWIDWNQDCKLKVFKKSVEKGLTSWKICDGDYKIPS